jgi:adenosylcobyric acid synthase (glutamine-hydrolysing) (EC 6.3.5.10)
MGWEALIHQHLRYGGKLIGVCGGFQMLGHKIHDPEGIEGRSQSCNALAFLEMETTLQSKKRLELVQGVLSLGNVPIAGYEIHAGITSGPALNNPVMTIAGIADGAFSNDNLVMGTYLHGLFDLPEACQALLNWAGCTVTKAIDLDQEREAGINLFADTLEANFDFSLLHQALGLTDKGSAHGDKVVPVTQAS